MEVTFSFMMIGLAMTLTGLVSAAMWWTVQAASSSSFLYRMILTMTLLGGLLFVVQKIAG